MAANSKTSSKTKSKGAKKPAPKKKAASNTAKKPSKPSPKRVTKPVTHTTTQKAPQKPLQTEKKVAEAGLAFDKKIDQLAKTSSSGQRSGKTFLKAFIGILIIIAAAAVVYLFYPRGKSADVKEDAANKPMPPAQDIKLPEPPKEPVKPKATDENIYIVKYKDQLTEISKQHYGNFIGWKRIYEANKDKIKNPNIIFPGQKLVIPKLQK